MIKDLPGLKLDSEKIIELCKKYGVIELRLFGSFATGQQHDNSDLYLLYALDDSKCIGWDIYVFCDELEVVVGRKVDLVPIKFVPEKYYEFMVKPSKDFYHAA